MPGYLLSSEGIKKMEEFLMKILKDTAGKSMDELTKKFKNQLLDYGKNVKMRSLNSSSLGNNSSRTKWEK